MLDRFFVCTKQENFDKIFTIDSLLKRDYNKMLRIYLKKYMKQSAAQIPKLMIYL